MMKFDMTIRVDPNLRVTEAIYSEGLMNVLNYLFLDFERLLISEERYFGIVKSYIHSVRFTYVKMLPTMNEEDMNIQKRILYLYKPLLKKEFRRLQSKHLTAADSCLCLIRKIISILEEIIDFKYKRELKTLRKIADKFFDNIKNRAKKDSLYNLAFQIKTYMKDGKVGKHMLDRFSLTDSDIPEKGKILEGDGTRLNLENGKIIEVGF